MDLISKTKKIVIQSRMGILHFYGDLGMGEALRPGDFDNFE
jgi:hypothetical protein